MPKPTKTATEIVSHCRQAIITKYLGPTDHRGSRVVARCEAGRLTWLWDHALDTAENHAAAAAALADKLSWRERDDLVCGGTGDGYVFVLVPRGNAAWGVTAGRKLLREGTPVAHVTRAGEDMSPALSPYEADQLTRRIATLLTEHGDGLEQARAALKEAD